MLISGFQPFTLLDYPGKSSCIIFTAGCNFRCGYCHNSEFVLPELITKIKDTFIPEEAAFNFLETRRGLLDGVVVSGGEPTIHPDIIPFLKKIKSMGFLVKLDSNGNRPEVIGQAIADGVVDYLAMDVKTSLAEYPDLVGKTVSPKRIADSIELIKASGIDYEFRATVIKETHTKTVLEDMAKLVAGAKKMYLQKFRPGHTLNPAFADYRAFSDSEMEEIAEIFRRVVPEVVVR